MISEDADTIESNNELIKEKQRELDGYRKKLDDEAESIQIREGDGPYQYLGQSLGNPFH
jgi:hypothetical protein